MFDMSTFSIGSRFGRLVIVGKESKRKYYCLCDCGNVKAIAFSSLSSGRSKSCGCYRKDVIAKINSDYPRAVTHGFARRKKKSSDYQVWVDLRNRCLNVNHKNYKNYGGRGITVCERWLESFEEFHEDMGPKPSKDHSIERINNDLGYCPENCKWGTKLEQTRNRRTSVYLEFNNKVMTLSEWSKELGIHRGTLYARIRSGWTIERTLTEPIQRREGKKLQNG